MINIFFSDVATGTFKVIRNDEIIMNMNPDNNSNEIFSLTFEWDLGYLKQPISSEYRIKIPSLLWYADHVRFHPEDEKDLYPQGKRNVDIIKKIKKLANKGETFRIWYSNCASELCGFYYMCNILKNYEVEIYGVSLPSTYVINNKLRRYVEWSCVDTNEYEYLIQFQRLLGKIEVAKYARIWRDLVKENAPLRVSVGNMLISAPEDYYDALILSLMPNGDVIERDWQYKVVSLSIGMKCGFISYRIRQMCQKGILNLVADGEDMGDRIWRKC